MAGSLTSHPFTGQVLRAIALLGLLALVLAVRLPNTSKLLAVLNDAAHAPVFGLISLVVLGSLGHLAGFPRIVAAFVIAVGLGMIVELVQGLSGRDASWFDVWTDALGALCALSFHAWRHAVSVHAVSASRAALIAALSAAVAVLYPVGEAAAAYALRAADRPRLADFDRPLSLYFVAAGGASADLRRLPAPWGKPREPLSLEIVVLQGQYPGITLTEPWPDWRGHQVLKLDVTNPGEEPLPLTLRVHDRAHDNQLSDRFNRTTELAPASRTVLSFPLGDIAAAPQDRTLDLGDVDGVILFTSGQGARPGRSFYVSGAWLE